MGKIGAMPDDPLSHLLTFVAVAEARSFARGAEKLGVTASAASHAVRALETKTGVRLLDRSTRSVTPTAEGQRLLEGVAPSLAAIDAEVASIGELSQRPAGTIRITALDFVAETILWPRLWPLLAAYPDVRLEINASYRMIDIVAERFDFGVRAGAQVAKDMVAVRISADYRRAVVGSPRYFERHPAPVEPAELLRHDCITMRLATSGGRFPWELRRKGGRARTLRVAGQHTFNNTQQILGAALSGVGLAFTPEPLARPHIEAGRLHPVLQEWWPAAPGFFLYYPSQRQHSKAQALVIDALRHRAN
jgi:DNA-binding transcriptional LysR family regulator